MWYPSEGDDGGGKVVEGHIGAVELFIADQKFAKAFKPAVCDLDNPALGSLARLTFELLRFLPSPLDVTNVAALLNALPGWLARVGCIGAQVPNSGAFALVCNFAAIEHALELHDVMAVGTGHDEREWDATPVDQQLVLAAIFFPDP